MKIAVIGSTHAGTAAVKNMAQLYPDAEIHVYERNDNVSFLSCGLALYVGGVVQNADDLFYSSPAELKAMGINVHVEHDVSSIDTDEQTIEVTDLNSGETRTDNYDRLVMTTGSWPVTPMIEGIELENILLAKNYHQANRIIEQSSHADHVTVVGAGYIGVELVEAFQQAGKRVTLIDGVDRILNKYLDEEFTDLVEADFTDKGIDMRLGETVARFEGDQKVNKVITDRGSVETDMVIMCVGFRPNTDLLQGKVDMLESGAIKVDDYMRTSNPNIFAAGDCCAVRYNPTGDAAYIPLATNAVRMGTLVARNIMKPQMRNVGTQGTSGLHIFGMNMASTGLTETAAASMGIYVKSVTINEKHRPEFMPTSEDVQLKVTFDPDSRSILGAQVISKADVTQSINTLSLAVQTGLKIDELAFVDFFFQPHFNQPWNFLNKAGLAAFEQSEPVTPRERIQA
ncbi:FAD-dependent oxidoreductase [Salisediminibacterium halotolerans]|uniref:NADPH-dependent 2,4-dienoyl-CoA reductase, sulfur reductase n=1 Tax=Salisediminibacterium halotolerans TaxID=517425 RepID=A0A1H9TAP4_9BACI|nr:FAD-dependent oxidoreductase [Salisediminibacterium haloalkalitolerans]SER94325.1 NADPH-dependent 2,4-dienoyl-CoA reductase, sulfur reductase [Salisediminibacterium haloalkalitolerans]